MPRAQVRAHEPASRLDAFPRPAVHPSRLDARLRTTGHASCRQRPRRTSLPNRIDGPSMSSAQVTARRLPSSGVIGSGGPFEHGWRWSRRRRHMEWRGQWGAFGPAELRRPVIAELAQLGHDAKPERRGVGGLVVPGSRVLLLLEHASRDPEAVAILPIRWPGDSPTRSGMHGYGLDQRSTLRALMKPGAAGRQGGSRSEVYGGGMCRRCSSILMA
jgi:hypothetical protein